MAAERALAAAGEPPPELGIMMPELGRAVVHCEGAALIRVGIAAMEPPGCGGE